MKISVLTFLACLFVIPSYRPHGEWKLVKNEEGVKVYTRHTEDSSLKELKLTANFNVSLSSMVTLMLDKNDYTKWVYACSESKLLKQVTPSEAYHYQVTNAPWPVQDRDMIIHSTITQNPVTKVVDVITKGAPDYMAEKEDRVRVRIYRADWRFTPKADGTVDAEYAMYVDPAGSLPHWVINLAISEGPLKSIRSMKSHLPTLAGKKVSFIKD